MSYKKYQVVYDSDGRAARIAREGTTLLLLDKSREQAAAAGELVDLLNELVALMYVKTSVKKSSNPGSPTRS